MHTPISIQQLCSVMYRKDIRFGKNQSAKIVGGRKRLEMLVADGLIRMEKPSRSQNGKWQCIAGDVIYYAKGR
ncbi:hypothetical protein [Petrimonas sulfuriphila]|uniref:hypothetical protein n=1 Tax=Petrimonas sulfuriphila TaxID=285070 RepID=UPI003EB91DFA